MQYNGNSRFEHTFRDRWHEYSAGETREIAKKEHEFLLQKLNSGRPLQERLKETERMRKKVLEREKERDREWESERKP